MMSRVPYDDCKSKANAAVDPLPTFATKCIVDLILIDPIRCRAVPTLAGGWPFPCTQLQTRLHHADRKNAGPVPSDMASYRSIFNLWVQSTLFFEHLVVRQLSLVRRTASVDAKAGFRLRSGQSTATAIGYYKKII
jgi:hypothetical protein